MMEMIKIGQIYKITRHRFGHINNIIVITRISDRRVDAIRTDGAAYKKSLDDLLFRQFRVIVLSNLGLRLRNGKSLIMKPKVLLQTSGQKLKNFEDC